MDFQSKLFMEKYKERFMQVVDANAIRRRLEIDEVIPKKVSHDMGKTSSDEATEMLYLHLLDNATPIGIHKLCDAMISKTGFGNMIELGHVMKSDKDLPPYTMTTELPGPAVRDTLEEFYKKTPTDPELLNVVEEFPVWDKIAIRLGVPINQVEAFQMQHMGGVKALSYWRNGRSGKDYPSTWGFLLKVVKEKMGSKPAEDLLKLVRKV